ncbi:hypothetical protein PTKIN_Ptkin11bG0118400 [Pterospermum kingtungense]
MFDPLVASFWVSRKAKDKIWVMVRFEKLSNFCYNYGCLGYIERNRTKKKVSLVGKWREEVFGSFLRVGLGKRISVKDVRKGFDSAREEGVSLESKGKNDFHEILNETEEVLQVNLGEEKDSEDSIDFSMVGHIKEVVNIVSEEKIERRSSEEVREVEMPPEENEVGEEVFLLNNRHMVFNIYRDNREELRVVFKEKLQLKRSGCLMLEEMEMECI